MDVCLERLVERIQFVAKVLGYEFRDAGLAAVRVGDRLEASIVFFVDTACFLLKCVDAKEDVLGNNEEDGAESPPFYELMRMLFSGEDGSYSRVESEPIIKTTTKNANSVILEIMKAAAEENCRAVLAHIDERMAEIFEQKVWAEIEKQMEEDVNEEILEE